MTWGFEKVERSDDPVRPITIWWSNHEWSDLTIDEARTLYEALQDAVGDRGTFRLSPLQVEAIKKMGVES